MENLLIQNSLCDDDGTRNDITEPNEQQMQRLNITPVIDEIDKRNIYYEISGRRCNAKSITDGKQINSKNDIGQADQYYTQERSIYPILQEAKDCNPCKDNGESVAGSSWCQNCEEYLCQTCSRLHKSRKATRTHDVVLLEDKLTEPMCDWCSYLDKVSASVRYCDVCEENLCQKCLNKHQTQKSTKAHLATDCEVGLTTNQRTCGSSRDANRSQERLPNSGSESTNSQLFTHKEKAERHSTSPERADIPGQPKLTNSKNTSTDSVSINWEPPDLKYDSCKYQIRYKEGEAGDWKFHEFFIAGDIHSTTVNKLRSNTVYTFQVRMVNNEKEGPYSRESEKINTPESAAMQLLDRSIIVQKQDCPIQVRKLNFTKDRASYNTEIKTRRLEIGIDSDLNTAQKTIMLLGATGSGKTTLVDSMANYILGVNWDDPFRLSAKDLEEEEKVRQENEALSQTQWVTCYTIHPMQGSRLDYTLNIVDTPGFGDSEGIPRDEEIVNQIRMLFNDNSEKGITFLDAICFLVKAPDAKMTPSQRYIFDSILSMFGKDIGENICLFITFADGNTPPVLEALKKN